MTSFLVLADEHPRYRDGVLISGGDFHQFVPYLAERIGPVRICMPATAGDGLSGRPEFANVTFVGTHPFGSYLRYLGLLPIVLWHNIPIFVREIRRSKFILIRMPSPNAPLVFAISKAFKKPTALLIAGNTRSVSRLNPRYRNPFMRFLRWAGSSLDWKATVMMARRSAVFAYGSQLASELQDAGVGRVHTMFTSLVTEKDISNHTDTCQGSDIRLLFVGRLAPEKGIDVLMDAGTRLAASGHNIHIDIVGDGPSKGLLEKKARELEDIKSLFISLHGYIPAGPALDLRFKAADVFVLPSYSEGVPKVLLKAMAAGLPIVASDVGGVSDIITSGSTGLLVTPGDPEKLAEALMKVVDNPCLRQSLIQNGYEFAREHTAQRQAAHFMATIAEYTNRSS